MPTAQPSNVKGESSGSINVLSSAAPSASVLSNSSSTGSSYSATVVFRQQPSSTTSSSGSAFDRNTNKRKSSVFSSGQCKKEVEVSGEKGT